MCFRYILLFVIFLNSGFMHPVHVTVTNIDYNLEEKAFDVSLKIYTDDLESVIRKTNQIALNLGKTDEIYNSNEKISEYIRNNFTISINNDKFAGKKLKFLKKENRDGAMWLYFRYPLTKKIKLLKVNNDLLNELYPDMTNLVIIRINREEKGYTLNKNTTSFQIKSES